MQDDEVVLVVPVLCSKVCFSNFHAEDLTAPLLMLYQEKFYQREDGSCVLEENNSCCAVVQEKFYQREDGSCVLVIFYGRKENAMLLF